MIIYEQDGYFFSQTDTEYEEYIQQMEETQNNTFGEIINNYTVETNPF